MPVSDFAAKLLLHSPELAGLDQANKAKRVNAVSFTADKQTYADEQEVAQPEACAGQCREQRGRASATPPATYCGT